MVNKNNPTIAREGQFYNLPLKTFDFGQRAYPSSHVLSGHDYAHADIIHLSAFFRDNPNPVLVCSPDGDVIKVNRVAVRLLKRLQLESTDLLPAEHVQIVQACLQGQFKEYTIEITVNNHILALTYYAMPAFEIVYLYAVEITDYRRAETELLQIVANTITLAKRAVRQIHSCRQKLPQPTVPTITTSTVNGSPDQNAIANWFVAMDGCVFAAPMGRFGEE